MEPHTRTMERSSRRSKNRLLLAAPIFALGLLLPALPQPTHAAPAVATPDMAAIDRYVEQQLETLRIPGASLGIVRGDQVVHLRGFGRADDSGRAMTAQTPTLIGSLTKSFTAVAIMQLVEQGKVDLDAPAQRYLPWFRVADPIASSQITVRHLLTHTSGLPGRREIEILLHEDTDAAAIERQVRALATVALTKPVGSTWQYASANYAVLGQILEAVSGQSYADYLRQHIFSPLQMGHSFPAPTLAPSAELATGHQYWFGLPRPARLPYPLGLLPAGYIVSSAEDMSRYLLAHLNGGRVGDARILTEESVAELHRPGFEIDQGMWSGLGWGVADMAGVRMLQHSGNTNNYRTEMWLLPESSWGFVLLTNASNQLQDSATLALGQGIAALLQGQAPQPVALNTTSFVLYGAILAIAGLWALGALLSIRTLRRWRAAPPPRALWRQIILPLAWNLLVALLFLVLIPALLFGGSLPAAIFLAPDLGYTLTIVGILAFGWGLLRTLFAWRLTREPAASSGSTVPTPA